jgi:WD40 repeat protein
VITPGRARRDVGWMASGRGANARARAATAAVAVAVTVAGCAAVPTSGAVQQFGGAEQIGANQQQNYPQPIPEPPGQGWNPQQIVSGFLAASASFADGHAVARQYLDPSAEGHWSPSWAVTVVSSMTTGSPVIPPQKQFASNEPGSVTRVTVNGSQVATLTDNGQLLASQGSHKTSATFTLIKINGQWRITRPLPPNLLIRQQDFSRVYRSRDIYFLAGSGRTVVPDPVFAPEQDTTTQLATGLVNALLQDPRGWLQGAATTAFPRGVTADVKIDGPNATVDLLGKGATANRKQQEQMAAQLAWTLDSGPIQSVELEINGRPLQVAGNQLQLVDTYSDWLPAPSGGSSLYYIGARGTVKTLSAGRVGALRTPGVPPLRSIAVSPNGRWIAGISEDQKVVYAWDLGHPGTLRKWAAETGDCTSLSWDSAGNLWITADGGLWMMAPGSPGAQSVSLPSNDTAVTAFRVSPDGVRAVMIVNNGTQLQLVALTHAGQSPSLGDPVAIGPGISDPEAVSWYDPDAVIVLAGSPSGGELEDVPLTGGEPIWTASEGKIVSMTATYPSGTSPNVAVGLSDGQVMVSTNLGAFQSTAATGQAPAFPG